jgi:hypothetical protein
MAAGLLAALDPALFELSRQTRPYALLVLVGALSSAALIDAVRRPRRAAWARYALVTALGCYVHLFMLALLAAHAAWATLYHRDAWRRGLGASAAVVALAAMPILVVLHAYPTVDAYIARQTPHLLVDTLYWFAGSRPLALAAIAAGVAALVWSWRSRVPAASTEVPALLVLWGCVPPLLVLAVSMAVKPMYTERYLAEALPAYLIGLGVVVARLPRPAALVAVAAFALGDLGTIIPVHGERGQDWRAATDVILTESLPNDGLVVYPERGTIPYGYYHGRLGLPGPRRIYPKVVSFPLMQSDDDPTFWERPSPLNGPARGYERIWFLAGWNTDARSVRGVGALIASLPPGYHLARRVRFVHETVLRFDRDPPGSPFTRRPAQLARAVRL